MSAGGSGNLGGEVAPVAGPGLKPYLRRKKSSMGETKIAILGDVGVGKSGKLNFNFILSFVNYVECPLI